MATASDLITEKQLLATVVEMAEANSWLVYHQLDQGGVTEDGRMWHGMRIGPGFPDLVLVRPRPYQLLFRELKSEKGKLSDAQQKWLTYLLYAEADARIWRPSDLVSGLIEETLR